MLYSSHTMQSPVGPLQLVCSDKGIVGILWENEKAGRVLFTHNNTAPRSHPLLLEAEQQLTEYFAHKRTCFDLPLDFIGSEFNKKVWNALLTIPYGETRSYGAIAQQIGAPKASRAVGLANSKNPISIIAPCHRVIGANGKLTGFAGGLDAKALLLNLEKECLLAA